MITVKCPHCGEPVIIEKVNCGIFRHGVLKKTGKQINSHLEKAKCDRLIKKGVIYGCRKPFRIVNDNLTSCALHIPPNTPNASEPNGSSALFNLAIVCDYI